MPKIVVTQPMYFSAEQKARLGGLGDVTFYDEMPGSPEKWLRRCQGFDIICTNIFGFRDKWDQLHDVFVSVPFVGVGFLETAKLRANHVTVANSPGCNRHAVNIQTYYADDPNYQKLTAHPRAYATPHIAFNIDVTRRIANDMMIDNVEAWLAGQPVNVIPGLE